MAIMFRTPHEGAEQYQKGLDLISVIQDIVRNPNVQKTVDAISQSILDCHTLSEAKKKELIHAEEMILQGKEILEDITKQKKDHADKVSNDHSILDSKKKDHEDSVVKFNSEKEATEKNLADARNEVDQKLAAAQKLKDEANEILSKAEQFKNVALAEKALHVKSVKEFQEKQIAENAALVAKAAAHDQKVREFEHNVSSFESRKKRFEDALKG